MKARKNGEHATEAMDSFRRIVQALRSSHRAAADVDLTGAQLFILTTLGASTRSLSVGELAERTRTDPSTASVVVSRLVERGLIKRARSSGDTRRVEVSLTPRGRALQLKTPATVAQTRLGNALASLSPSDSTALVRILGTVVELMGEADAAAPMLFDEANDRSAPPKATRPQPRAAVKKRRTRSEPT
jgi:DNA-binding MarR family transcriptional regulator